jgi:hypothetical protein
MYRKWLTDALVKLGPAKSRSGLARHLGKSPAAITLMLQGKQKIPADMLPDIATYLGLSLPTMPSGSFEPAAATNVVRGSLCVGRWYEVGICTSPIGPHFVPAVPDPSLSGRQQYCMVTEDSCVEKLKKGEYGLFIEYDDEPLADRQIVHIRTTQGDKFEDCCRRVRLIGRNISGEIDNPPTGSTKKSIKLPSADTRVIGVLVGVFRPSSH